MKHLRIILITLTIVLCSAALVFADGPAQVKITTDAPATGQPVTAEITNPDQAQLDISWYVGGKKTSCHEASYIPTAADYESWISVELTDGNGEAVASDRIYFSKLPVVYINTDDGAPVTSKDEYTSADLKIQGSCLFDAQYDGKTEIKGRGNSTWAYDKKPYKLKLDKKTDIFGFGKCKHYVLMAIYLDSSLLRNTLASRLSAAAGLTATDSTWVEVIMNGEYIGCYQFCEHIRTGKQLVNISDWEDLASDAAKAISKEKAYKKDFPDGYSDLEDYMVENLSWITSGKVTFNGKEYEIPASVEIPSDLTGGCLFELDQEENKELTSFKTKKGISVHVNSPEYLFTNEEMYQKVRDYIQSVEDALTSTDGYSPDGKHYSELVDVDSMITYWLIMEFLSNDDASSGSRYCYKDIDGKLTFGPVWDFDVSSGAYRAFMDPIYWTDAGSPWGWYRGQDIYKEMVDDPYFQVKAQEKYWQLRPLFKEFVEDGGLIDQYAEYLYEAGVANETKWVTWKDLMGRNFSGKYGDINIYKAFLKLRLLWMDTAFRTEKSAHNNMFILLSSTPYIQSGLSKIVLRNATEDVNDHGADYAIKSGEDLKLAYCGVPGESSIYVNGILYGKYPSIKLMKGLTLPYSGLNADENGKNVISIITTYGKKTFRNHLSFVVEGAVQPQLAFADYPELTEVCSDHSLVHIDCRQKTAAKYGLKECWYCDNCHRYFADENGTKLLKAKNEIIPVNADIFSGTYVQKIVHLYRIGQLF